MQMDWSLSLHYCQIYLNKSIITALPFRRRRIEKSLEVLLYLIITKSKKKKVQSLNIHLYITFKETHVSHLII